MATWQQIFLGIFLLPALLFALWQLHFIMPVFWVNFFFQKYRTGEWAGKNTAQFLKEMQSGFLRWGYNRNTRSEYIIFNGDLRTPSWQIQNWRPRLALWGPRPKWMYKKEKVLENLPTFEIQSRSEAELGGKLPPTHPMRTELEKEMREDVREQVELARGTGYAFYRVQAINLLRNSLTVKPWQNESSFAGWLAKRGMLIGTQECYKIGASVCTEMGFTLAEAQSLYDELEKEVKFVEV